MAHNGNGRTLWLAPVITALLVIVIGGLVLSTYPRLSPVDELQHVDSAIKASQGRWYLPPGESVGQDAMRIQACDGIDAGWPTPACDTPQFDPLDFQELGINTAAGRPSLYYVVTGYLGQAVASVTGMGFLLSARIISLLSLALGAAALTYAALRLSRSPALAVALGTLCATLPPVLSQGIAVNPDAWSLLAGTAVTALALAAPRHTPGRFSLVLIVAVTLTVLVKPNFVVLAIVPVILLGVSWSSTRDRASLHRLLGAVAAAAVAGLAFVATMIPAYLSDSRLKEAPQIVGTTLPEGAAWPIGPALDDILRNFVPMYQPSPVDLFETTGLVGLAATATVVLIGGSLAALMTAAPGSRGFGLGLCGVLGLVLTPALVFAGQFISNAYFPYPQRYSFVVLPILALSWAALRPRRSWPLVVVASAVALGVLYAYWRVS